MRYLSIRLLLGMILSSAGILAGLPQAFAQHQHTVLWGDYYDPYAIPTHANHRVGGSDWAKAITTANKRVFAVGSSQKILTIQKKKVPSTVFTVRAFHTAKAPSQAKQLLWVGQENLQGEALAVAADADRVYAVGYTYSRNKTIDSFGTSFAVRAYSAKTGKLIWGDDFKRNPKGAGSANAVAVNGSLVFVAGSDQAIDTGQDFTVRAYNARTGKLVWERYVSGDSHAAESASAVTASDQMVYVVGTTADSNGDLGFTVHAYDHAGKLVWNDRYNQVPGKSGYDVARCAVLQGSRLFVAGTTETAKNNRDFTVRAYDALGNKNGTANLLWWEDFNRASHVDANARLVKDDEALAIAADSYHVYVVGYTSDYHKERPLRVKDQDFSIRVYSVKKTQATGDNPGGAHVLWWDYLDGVDMGGNVDGASVAHAVAVFKDRIYVGGQMEKHTSDPDSYVIAYPVANDPPAPEKRAKYLWQDIYEDADHTCKGGSDATYGIAVDQDGVYTAGMLENPEGNSDLCTVVFKP